VEWHRDAKAVASGEARVLKLQAGRTPKVFKKPQSGWCADA
jgi:hypothetical protein